MSDPSEQIPADDLNFPHAETDVVHSLNVPRSVVRDARRSLTEGVDWSRKKTRGASAVGWSEAGLARLRALILPAAGKAPGEAASADSGAAAAGWVKKTAAERLEVVAMVSAAMPWMLPCIGPGGGRDRSCWVFVRVLHGERFRPGMKIWAERGSHGGWRYLGNGDDPEGSPVRYPRGLGVW